MKKRLLAFLLALVMTLGMIPTATQAHAHEEEELAAEIAAPLVEETPAEDEAPADLLASGEVNTSDPAKEGTYVICFVCGEEDVVYCEECKRCLYCESLEFCSDCEVCDDCIDEDDWCDNKCGNHLDCQGVDFTDCWHYCYDCAEGNIFICSDCNLCEQCVGIACEECQRCTECVARYSEDCTHCADCYPLCEMCDICAECEGLEFCRSCINCEGCVDMCQSCYEYCADCVTVCEDCGTCTDCVEDFCWDCNRCSECVDICEDCGEYCADCVTICEDCGACENCVGEAFCVDCGVCSECVAICQDCYEVCENCADYFCENCGWYGSCCTDICENCNLCDSCVNVCPDCLEVCSDCGTICNNCYYCEDCCICDTLPHFVQQPKDGEVVTDDGKAFVSWRVNFTPTKLLIMKKGSRLVYATLAVNKRTYELEINEDPGYIIRAYYGSGTNDYVDSNVFYVRKVAPRVTLSDAWVEDNDVYAKPNELITVEWTTNFTPKRQYIEKDSKFYMELGTGVRSYKFSPVTNGENYVIRAYYTDEKFMDSDEFFIYAAEFSTQPVGGAVDSGEKFTVNWNVTFPPFAQKLITYNEDGNMIATQTLENRQRSIELSPGKYSYRIRSYYEADKYLESDLFAVTEKVDTVDVYFCLGKSPTASIEVVLGSPVTPPADPYQEGLTFLGWHTDDGELYDFSLPVS